MEIKLPLAPNERELVIKRIVESDSPSRTGERIVGSNKAYNVYSFPLDSVTYNSKNTRFKSEALTYKAENKTDLDVENQEHFQMIERYIWEQNPTKNKETINSLIETGQQVPGIITRDGIVISGNRRLRLINEIHRSSSKHNKDIPFFEAVVLDEKDMTRERIIELETYYQFGEDTKEDYDPIQKYLAVHEQHVDDGVSIDKLAKNYYTDTKTIRKWLEVHELMIEYLEYHDIVGHFDYLKNKEDPFLGLNSKIKQLKNGGGNKVDWPYDNGDIEQLKELYFDYLFLDLFTKEKSYRDILKVFDTKSSWDKVLSKYDESMGKSPIRTVDEVKEENPDLTEKQAIKKAISENANLHEEDLRLGLGLATNDLRIKEIINRPTDLADEAKESVVALKQAIQKLKRTNRDVEDKKKLRLSLMTIRNITKDIEDLLG